MNPQNTILLDVDRKEHYLSLLDLEKEHVILEINTTKELLANLVDDYDLLNFESLTVSCEARPWRKKGFIIEGTIKAEYTQKCVVSLKPVPQSMNRKFFQKFTSTLQSARSKEIEIDPLEPDDVEELSEERIELFAFILEVFALELDLYPRLKDVEIDETYSPVKSTNETLKRASPFAILKGLKDKN